MLALVTDAYPPVVLLDKSEAVNTSPETLAEKRIRS